ncbi:MAG: ABC transporter ATP-binding protein [Cellulosilyticaceae bacterium]
MTKMIELKNIYKSFYTKEGEIVVLEDVNLTLEKGKILGILGPSGSGKSTILNILTDLIKPTEGEVNIRGKIGYMFQKDHLLEWRNIMDNITIGLEIQKSVTPESIEHIEEMLKMYGLWEFRNRYPRELSGGMRQRVALIRTLATKPDVLLLDEPFSALDYQTRLMVSDDIYKIIKRENKEAILVTHDIAEAISMADEVVVLSKRPATVKSQYPIELTIAGEKTPLIARKAPEFKDYFDILWKELAVYEKE